MALIYSKFPRSKLGHETNHKLVVSHATETDRPTNRQTGRGTPMWMSPINIAKIVSLVDRLFFRLLCYAVIHQAIGNVKDYHLSGPNTDEL